MKPTTIHKIPGGITAPRGFLAAGLHAGIKKPSILDLALVASEQPGPVAGLFTTNQVAAAPVVLDRLHLKQGQGIGRAFIVNSGNANACTGAQGLADAKEMAKLTAQSLGVPVRSILVGSTGVIGQFLPMTAIRDGVPRLVQRLRRTGGHEAAKAILTTDLKAKEVALQAKIAGRTVTVGGMAKGSGMIHPNMATMLAYLTTDAAIAQPTLQRALRAAADLSFNCISVDGDTSTNDTVLCLANGLAGNAPLREGTNELASFQAMLNEACRSLAMHICGDGEGVTKIVQVLVKGAKSVADAKAVADTVGTSCLVKTAFFGEDANWGRIMAAVGRAGVRIKPERIGLAIEGVPIVKQGVSLGRDAERAIEKLFRRRKFRIVVDLGIGSAQGSLWTTDLSYEYVRINASYRS
ncbi:MAG: bifunctional glutamate N-acetyltransferase/amino-acid acetyltransferase ArgJ [Nitrospirota bacterium]|jgi:N-acetylglutamate synthase (EC 2.3.1.1)/glutamate N-acetyltransferase (EC 2.3.1.35)|nr:bifunctional glutamate N-acetyltransferase/amino-acid acetyltransferase ArgJ [Nitrospirota bacterium]